MFKAPTPVYKKDNIILKDMLIIKCWSNFFIWLSILLFIFIWKWLGFAIYIETCHFTIRLGYLCFTIAAIVGIKKWNDEEEFMTLQESLKFIVPYCIFASSLMSLLGNWGVLTCAIFAIVPIIIEVFVGEEKYLTLSTHWVVFLIFSCIYGCALLFAEFSFNTILSFLLYYALVCSYIGTQARIYDMARKADFKYITKTEEHRDRFEFLGYYYAVRSTLCAGLNLKEMFNPSPIDTF